MCPSPVSPSVSGGSVERPPPLPAAANNLLSKLPPAELAELLEHSSFVDVELRAILSESRQKIEDVYFPLTGMISLVTQLKDGTSLESMTVGREGFAGLSIFHGVPSTPTVAMCQIEGTFLRIPAESFKRLLVAAPELVLLLHRYAQFAHELVAQTAACNSMHRIEQRCARWLLISSDAVGKNELGLTHEFLSQMLAVRRPGVTVAIGALEKLKLIVHRYGKISILDKKKLESVACECYRTVKDRERELLA